MAETLKNFPSIPVSHFLNLRNQFKKSIPGTITANYLATILSMTESSTRTNLMPSLRIMGLIDAEGKTNQELAKKFRDDQSYASFCEEMLKKIYPEELLDTFPDKDSNKDKIKTWFMNHSSVGESGASKYASFFWALLQGDPAATSSSINSTKSNDNKTKSPKIKSSGKSQNITKPLDSKAPPPPATEKNNFGPDLNINIQIHISSDASADQIKNIFENMAKYVYQKNN